MDPVILNIQKMEAIARRRVGKSAVDQALSDYQKWAAYLKEDKKQVAHLLYFLKSLEERSNNKGLKEDRELSAIILGQAEVPSFERRQREEKDYLKLVKKEISPKYQIEMEFQDPKGFKVKTGSPELSI